MARSKLLIACPETNADLLYLCGFRAPDAFAYLETAGKKHILLNDLEIDRGRAEAKVDFVESYSEFSKLAEKTPGKTPTYAKVVATWLLCSGRELQLGEAEVGLIKNNNSTGVQPEWI